MQLSHVDHQAVGNDKWLLKLGRWTVSRDITPINLSRGGPAIDLSLCVVGAGCSVTASGRNQLPLPLGLELWDNCSSSWLLLMSMSKDAFITASPQVSTLCWGHNMWGHTGPLACHLAEGQRDPVIRLEQAGNKRNSPPQEIIFVRILVKQLNFEVLARVLVHQCLMEKWECIDLELLVRAGRFNQ